MMWSSWEVSWFTTGLLIAFVLGGLTTLIVLALHDEEALRTPIDRRVTVSREARTLPPAPDGAEYPNRTNTQSEVRHA